MLPAVLTDAESQYLERIREDCELLLRPDADVLGVSLASAAEGVRLVVRYRLGASERESAASGSDLLAAHVGLRSTIVEDRLRFAFSDLVEPR
jgi:hypothetical protein